MKPTHTEGPWRVGHNHSIVSDVPIEGGPTGGNEAHYYGGFLVAETVAPRNRRIIAAAPLLLRSLFQSDALIREAQSILARYIVPDSGISDSDVVSQLLGLLDGPLQRSVQQQTLEAMQKAIDE